MRAGRLPLISVTRAGALRDGCGSDAAGFFAIAILLRSAARMSTTGAVAALKTSQINVLSTDQAAALTTAQVAAQTGARTARQSHE